MAAIYSNRGNRVTAGIFLASILLKEMRYLVNIRYLWDEHFSYIRSRRNTSPCSFFLGMRINRIQSGCSNVYGTVSSDTVHSCADDFR